MNGIKKIKSHQFSNYLHDWFFSFLYLTSIMKYHYHYGLLNQFSTMNPFIDPIPAPISQLLGRTVVINIVLVMNTAETLITWRQTTNKSTNDKYNVLFFSLEFKNHVKLDIILFSCHFVCSIFFQYVLHICPHEALSIPLFIVHWLFGTSLPPSCLFVCACLIKQEAKLWNI
jgi:hypothetical protein